MKTLRVILPLIASLSLCQFAQANQHAFFWSSSTGMVDLGTLGGANSLALGINNSGEVVGYSFLADNVTKHAFTWTAATGMVDIGTLPGGGTIEAQAVNDAGDVTGDAVDANGVQVPYFWSPTGGFTPLGESVGDSRNYGFGINNNDHITGQRYNGETVHAFDWTPGGAFHTLPPLPGGLHGVGNGINDRDSIVGAASNSRGAFVATYWPRGATAGRAIPSLSKRDYSDARGINESDEVVGFEGASVSTGFYWSRSTGTIILQTLGGATAGAFAINESSAIVGYSTNSASLTHAVIWADKNSAPQDLGTLSGGANSYAVGLNDVGQACGYADVP